jgi:two-component system cell cycle sensor histidine kinase/response regulator CckA
VRLPDAPVIVQGDASALQQVLVNLCTNAEYAMRAAGAGTLTLALQDHPQAEPPQAVLEVRDTGPGIPADVRDRLFEPFYTTKPVGEGTGMGLAVVHGVVAAHGGTIGVESAPGLGACFRVALPLADGAPPPAAAPAPPPRGTGRVLLVEDEPALARFAVQALTRAGFAVHACHDGAEALRVFGDDPAAFDILVSDVAMPGLTGDKLARELLRLRPTLPVVLMTGFSHSVTSDRAAALGAATLLQKPFGGRELVAAVRDAIGEPGR